MLESKHKIQTDLTTNEIFFSNPNQTKPIPLQGNT